MARRFSEDCLRRWLTEPGLDQLTELSCLICGSKEFDLDDPGYGLASPAFVLIECLKWLAQSARSGACTYYESTTPARQSAMYLALGLHADHELCAAYGRGMHSTDDDTALSALDEWICEHETEVITWLGNLVCVHRELFRRLLD
jgi:hypothetical protein